MNANHLNVQVIQSPRLSINQAHALACRVQSDGREELADGSLIGNTRDELPCFRGLSNEELDCGDSAEIVGFDTSGNKNRLPFGRLFGIFQKWRFWISRSFEDSWNETANNYCSRLTTNAECEGRHLYLWTKHVIKCKRRKNKSVRANLLHRSNKANV